MEHLIFWYVLMISSCWVKTNITTKSTEGQTDGSKEVVLEVNAFFTCCYQTTGQSEALAVTFTDLKCIHQETRNCLNSGNASYRADQNLLPSCLLAKNVKTKQYKSMIVPIILYGCETWSLPLRQEHGWTVSQNVCT
jgi:hypothetical protein